MGESSTAPPGLERLGQGDAFARSIIEQSPFSTVVYDPDGRPVFVNPAFEELFGVGLDSVPAEYTVLQDAQLERAGVMPIIRRAFQGERVSTPAVRYDAAEVSGTGRARWTQGTFFPLRDASGSLIAVVLTHHDLTARVEAEEAVRLSEQHLRVALEAARLGTWEWEIATGRVVWSSTLEQIHGLQPGTFGGSFEDYLRDVHPEEREHVLATIRRSVEGAVHALNYRIVRPDGEVRWLEAHGRLLRAESGAPARIVGVCRDVTESRRAEDATRFLADVTPVLHESLGLEDTLEAIGRLSVPRLADYCIVDVVERGEVRRCSATHADASRAPLMEIVRRSPPSLARAEHPVAQALRTGEPVMVPEWDPMHNQLTAMSDDHLEALQQLAPRSLIVVPVTGQTGVLGAISLVAGESGRRYGEADLALARELARRAGIAVENAQLLQEISGAREELELRSIELEQQVEEAQALNVELEHTAKALSAANRRAEEAVSASVAAEHYVRSILDSITDPLVVTDVEWRYRYINDAAHQVFLHAGRGGREALIGRVMWEVYPDLEGTLFATEMRRAVSERTTRSFEERYQRSGRWSEIHCYPLPDGGLATSWKDVTDRRHEEESRRYLDRANEILSASLDYEATLGSLAELLVPELADWCAVTIVDDDGEWRQLAVAHVDRSKVALARELNEKYPPDPEARYGTAQVIRTGEPEMVVEISDDLLARAARDEEHLKLLRSLQLRSGMTVPLRARDRTLGAITLIFAESDRRYGERDLTLARELARRAGMAVDNARLYRAAIAARAEAERSNRAKSEFLTVMSHELRTPLNAIAGYAQLLELGVRGPVTQAQREDLERIRRSQQHLLSLINDVLNYARLEAGRVQFDMRPLALHPLLLELETLVAPQLTTKQLGYVYEPVEPSLLVHCDPEKLRQILINLLTNAIKFTDVGGSITVSASITDGVVSIDVADTGRGIPRTHLRSIFEPFVQVQRSLSSLQEGTGLGLAISRDLARGMGGDVVVKSRVGKGSIFSVVLQGQA